MQTPGPWRPNAATNEKMKMLLVSLSSRLVARLLRQALHANTPVTLLVSCQSGDAVAPGRIYPAEAPVFKSRLCGLLDPESPRCDSTHLHARRSVGAVGDGVTTLSRGARIHSDRVCGADASWPVQDPNQDRDHDYGTADPIHRGREPLPGRNRR